MVSARCGCAQQRRANRPPLLVGFVLDVILCATSLWVNGPLVCPSLERFQIGVRCLLSQGVRWLRHHLLIGLDLKLGRRQVREQRLGTTFAAGKLGPQLRMRPAFEESYARSFRQVTWGLPSPSAWPKSRIVQFPHTSPFPEPAAGHPPAAGR